MTWLMALGVLFFILGLGGDCSNFALRKAQRRGENLRVSPIMRAPLLLNWCGLALLFVATRSHHVNWFLSGVILLFLFHVFCLRGFER